MLRQLEFRIFEKVKRKSRDFPQIG